MSDKWLDDEELRQILGTSEEVEEEKEIPVQRSATVDDSSNHLSKKPVEAHSVQFEELTDEYIADGEMAELELLFDIPLEVRVLLGSVEKTIEEILEMEEGKILQTEKLAGEPVEIMVADQVIAKGETVIIDDKFGVLITEIVSPRERINSIEGKLKRQKQ